MSVSRPPQSGRHGIQVVATKLTDVGRSRDHNEDYSDFFVPQDAAIRAAKGDLYLVADGMGGHQAGEVASQGAVDTVIREYYADPSTDIAASLTQAIRKANSFIHKQAQSNSAQTGMGTTVVAMVMRGREVHVANVGDSRVYLVREGKISQITTDHSFVEEQVKAGILTKEEARHHPHRNVITRALGSKPDVQVDTYQGDLHMGDIFILCSDGLTGHVEDAEILQAAIRSNSPEQAAAQLVQLANDRGGSDNISLIIAAAVPATAPIAASPTAPSPSQPPADAKTAALPSPGAVTVPVKRPEAPAPTKGRRKAARGALGVLLIGLIAVLLVGLLGTGGFMAWRAGWFQGFVPASASPSPAVATQTPLTSPLETTTPVPPTPTLAPVLQTQATSTLRPTETSTPTPQPNTPAPRTPPNLLKPEDGQEFPAGTPVGFAWEAVALREGEEFVLLINDVPRFAGRADNVTLPLEPGEYTWRVEVRNAAGVTAPGMVSVSRQVVIQGPPPPDSGPSQPIPSEATAVPTEAPTEAPTLEPTTDAPEG